MQLQVDEERFHPDKSCFIVLNQRNEVFFIFSKIKINILNMNFFIKRIFAIFMLSVQVRMIVVLWSDKKVFFTILVDSVYTDSVNEKS